MLLLSLNKSSPTSFGCRSLATNIDWIFTYTTTVIFLRPILQVLRNNQADDRILGPGGQQRMRRAKYDTLVSLKFPFVHLFAVPLRWCAYYFFWTCPHTSCPHIYQGGFRSCSWIEHAAIHQCDACFEPLVCPHIFFLPVSSSAITFLHLTRGFSQKLNQNVWISPWVSVVDCAPILSRP